MIRNGLILALMALPWVARAVEPAPGEPPATEAVEEESPKEDHTLERHRTPLEALSERTLGTASRAVRFDWHKSRIGFGVVGSEILELNNFFSARIGGLVRAPLGSFMAELAISWVATWGSHSSELLALTPFRQFGRPGRLQLDFNFGFPLAEGVATARVGFIPATELVFSLNAGFRYFYYPGSMAKLSAGEVAGAIFSPRLSDTEIENLQSATLPGMQVDRGRYNLLIGFSLDIYFQPFIFIAPRMMISPPIFAIGSPGLGWWWELSLSAGVVL